MNYLINKDECFEKGLLKKDASNTDLAKKSLKQAEFFLNETEDLIKLNKKQIAKCFWNNNVYKT